MKHDEHDPCETIRQDLTALLYGELEGSARARVEEHLQHCGECAQAQREMDAAVELLGKWELPTNELAAARSSGSPALRRRSRLRPIAIGVAAAALAFFTLSAFGSTARVDAGAVTLTLRSPWASEDSVRRSIALAEAEREQRLRDIACEELERWALARSEDDRRRLEEWSALERADRLELARAVERVLAADRRVLASWLDAFSAGRARVDRHTQDALVELASYVVHDPNQRTWSQQ